MKAKVAFIPCAGFGSRMGPIGKSIPKPLWPLFGKTLLEHQINYCRELGFSHFVINAHHLKDQFIEFEEQIKLKEGEKLSILVEDPLLGNGGSFHNIKKSFPDIEEVFVFNPDSFLMMSPKDWSKFFNEAELKTNLLITIPCKEEDQYNRFVVDKKNCLLEIRPPSAGNAPNLTYAGFGKVNLEAFPYVKGASSFFETVADPKTEKVFTYEVEDYEYWDLGTLDLYRKVVSTLHSNKNTRLYSFLKNYDSSDTDFSSYNAEKNGCFNFTQERLSCEERGIFIRKDLPKIHLD